MRHCKECGAEASENARFCLQCGSVLPSEGNSSAQPQAELDFLQPALTGGMFLGLLSSLPLISIGNALCCMWVLGGGAIAAFLVSKQRPSGITYGDGAFAGVLSGLFGAIIATIVSIPVRIISTRMFAEQQRALEEAFKDMPNLDGPIKELFMRMASPEVSVVVVSFTFFMNLLVFSLFAMIGGILMVAILDKRGAGSRPRPSA